MEIFGSHHDFILQNFYKIQPLVVISTVQKHDPQPLKSLECLHPYAQATLVQALAAQRLGIVLLHADGAK